MLPNKYIILIFLLVNTDHLLAQINLRPNQYEGYVMMSDSIKKEMIIEVEDAKLPWAFQEKVRYFDKSLATGSRVKREVKKDCIPGEVIEYGIGGRKFMYINHHIKDKKDKNIASSAISKFKDDKNSDFFAEVIKEGKIKVLILYPRPEISEDDYENDTIMDQYKKTSEATFDLLLSKIDQKPKSVNDINFKGFFKDCLFIVKKFEDEKYTIGPKKGLNVIMLKDRLAGPELRSAVELILQDYRDNCGDF